MSLNQWEMVTKSKKQKNLEKKIEARHEKNRIAAQGPSLQEILPSHEYRKIISDKASKFVQKESPTKSTSSSSKSEKKQVVKSNLKIDEKTKKNVPQKSKKKQQVAKSQSLEASLRKLTPEDFLATLEQLKLSYPGSELLWLKGIASYFSTNLPFECDPVFCNKSLNYPTNLASISLKGIIIDFLNNVGESNNTYFYHTLLNSMAVELSMNLPIFGYKFMLQLIGQTWPQICIDNMARTAMLCNSYQNRSSVFLSILWAIGQGGTRNLMVGIKVWQNLMLPHIEMKNYSKYIVEYIEKILHSSSNQSLTMNQVDFFNTYKVLKKDYHGLPKNLKDSLSNSAELFLLKYIKCSSKHSNLFSTLLCWCVHPTENLTELNGCLNCLLNEPNCCKVWKLNFKRQSLPSALLLQYIEQHRNGKASALLDSKEFHNFLQEIKFIRNEINYKTKMDRNLIQIIDIIDSVGA